MSHYTPTPVQLAVLSALAAGRVTFDKVSGTYIDGRTGATIGAPTVRRLRLEELINHAPHGDPLALTVLGESVLAAYLPGAVGR